MIEESKPERGQQCSGQSATKQARDLRWEEWNLLYASTDIWTKRMLAGLRTGIKGKKWFSLADKVWREKSLLTAYDRVQDRQRWRNSYFEELGLFSLEKAHESFCESHEVIVRWQLMPSNTDGNH